MICRSNILSKIVVFRREYINFFSSNKKMISMMIDIDGQQQKFNFSHKSKLSRNLEKIGVPLQFECGYECSCGTCAIELQPQTMNRIKEIQPIKDNELETLKYQRLEIKKTRLSCQLEVTEEMQGIVLKI